MRYDTLATFIYDENSGKVGSQESKSVIEKIFCNVTELGAEKSQLVMGNLKDKTYRIFERENPLFHHYFNSGMIARQCTVRM